MRFTRGKRAHLLALCGVDANAKPRRMRPRGESAEAFVLRLVNGMSEAVDTLCGVFAKIGKAMAAGVDAGAIVLPASAELKMLTHGIVGLPMVLRGEAKIGASFDDAATWKAKP